VSPASFPLSGPETGGAGDASPMAEGTGVSSGSFLSPFSARHRRGEGAPDEKGQNHTAERKHSNSAKEKKVNNKLLTIQQFCSILVCMRYPTYVPQGASKAGIYEYH